MSNNEMLANLHISKEPMKQIYDWVKSNQITLEQFYMAVSYYISIIVSE